MTQDQAFLAAIIEEPDDDTPRLVYADFLLERDGPGDRERQEFVRVQCELAGLYVAQDTAGSCGGSYCDILVGDSPLHSGCRIETLRRRERELVEKYGATWIADMLKTL